MVQARWAAEVGSGIEHLDLSVGSDGIEVESVIVGDRFGTSYGLRYHLLCALDWSVRRVEVEVIGGESLILAADGAGNWFSKTGALLTEFRGCIDVDIAATPFTNTLPIRRLDLAEGERRELPIVYIPAPSLKPEVTHQAYTCLEAKKRYLYQGLDSDFEAELSIDGDGLVHHYPDLFRRVA